MFRYAFYVNSLKIQDKFELHLILKNKHPKLVSFFKQEINSFSKITTKIPNRRMPQFLTF